MNACYLLLMSININVYCTNIIKTDLQTAFCGQILCDSKEFLSKFSLIIFASNETKGREIKKTIIGISKFFDFGA